jgi:hypothetical protein
MSLRARRRGDRRRWLFGDRRGGAFSASLFDVSPDGRTFYTRQRTTDTDAAMLLLNWQSLLDGADRE